MTEEDWDSVLNVNLKGMFNTCQAAIAHMREKKYGRIINISSRAWLGWPGQANYSASKGGVVSLSRTLALEMAKHKITVNCIAPGIIRTPLFDMLTEETRKNLLALQPVGRIGEPEEIAYGVMFFASDESNYVTGQTIFICGGKSIFSSLSV
jgi:NAD(P)-dependent dehydrogenase (short-subunit alcohol dehydrogenase family)